jgi:hypothetical protein
MHSSAISYRSTLLTSCPLIRCFQPGIMLKSGMTPVLRYDTTSLIEQTSARGSMDKFLIKIEKKQIYI